MLGCASARNVTYHVRPKLLFWSRMNAYGHCLLAASNRTLTPTPGIAVTIQNGVEQISLEHASDAYNPAALALELNAILLVYRVNPSPKNGSGDDRLEACIVDRNFRVISRPHVLHSLGRWCEDPRLVLVNNDIWLVYGCPSKEGATFRERGIGLANLRVDLGSGSVSVEPCGQVFKAIGHRPCEKNWSPFAYCDRLLFSYSICPHVVLHREGDWECLASTSRPILWPSTFISGGTPAVWCRQTDEYLAFFHAVSFPFDALRHSASFHEKCLSHTRYYTFGAYTFTASPPFSLRRVSPYPLTYEGIFSIPNQRVTRDRS